VRSLAETGRVDSSCCRVRPLNFPCGLRKTTSVPASSATDEPPRGRLPKGALHGLVEDFLAEPDRRGNAYTPGEIGRKLDRSQGAVRNTLDKLTEKGTVTLVQTGPAATR
jgi:hypothetical protein